MSNFLQEHYNDYRDLGGDHEMYAIVNDLTYEKAEELRKNYESTHPPVSKERISNYFL